MKQLLTIIATALLLVNAAFAGQPHVDAKVSPPRQTGSAAFMVDGKVALSSFQSLCDAHLLKLADSLQAVASGAAARSQDWERIRPSLNRVAKTNVPAALWFATADGSYSTLEQGPVKESLASRAYFPRLMAGKRVIGDLVVSKSTGKSVAIVAVPIFAQDKSVNGALGASVHLDKLSDLIRQEMNLDDSMIFYTFDASPILGLVWDSSLILVDPTMLGQGIDNVFREMLSREQGQVSYVFREVPRTVLYRKSAMTGWWYAFGRLNVGAAARTATRNAVGGL